MSWNYSSKQQVGSRQVTKLSESFEIFLIISTDSKAPFCGGTLISPNYVLTGKPLKFASVHKLLLCISTNEQVVRTKGLWYYHLKLKTENFWTKIDKFIDPFFCCCWLATWGWFNGKMFFFVLFSTCASCVHNDIFWKTLLRMTQNVLWKTLSYKLNLLNRAGVLV